MAEDDDKELTPNELLQLEAALKNFGGSVPEEKHGVHIFLTKVAESNDTTKTGNLNEEELGLVSLPLRTLKNCSLWADKLCEDDILKELFKEEAEIVTSTSLSKNAKLIDLAVVTRREVADRTKRGGAKNKSWFKKKTPEGEQ